MKCRECQSFDRGKGCKTGLCKWALYINSQLLMTDPEDECHFH